MFAIVAFLIFSVALGIAGYYAWSVPRQEEAQVMAARLRELRTRSTTGTPRRTSGPRDLMRREEAGTFGFLTDLFSFAGSLRRVQQLIDQADLKYRAADVVVVSVILTAGTYLLLGLFGLNMLILRVVLSALVGAVPMFLILRVRSRRLAKFESVFPDAIDLFNRSMKAGHTIHSGLETISTESVDPVKSEFKKVMEELGLGSQIDAALLNLGARIPIIDLKFFITGLILQRQTGANMTEVLDNLSLLVRERLNMAAKMKAHTSQQRLSAALLCGLPIVLGTVFWILRPEMMNLLITDETGNMFFTYGIISEIVGILVIRKMANPKF
jgi:tight adherence protein B